MKVFDAWNKGELESFLIEITRDIMAYNDSDGKPLVEKILDSAGQKGTGKWTAISSLEYGVPVTLIGKIFSDFISSSDRRKMIDCMVYVVCTLNLINLED